MATQVDLVLKNAAAVNKTFSKITPSAGDKSVAQWWLKEGAINGAFPKFTSEAHATGNNSRKTSIKLTLPYSYTESTTGLTKIGPSAEFNGSASMPNDFPEALKADFVAYIASALADAMVKEMLSTGTSAT